MKNILYLGIDLGTSGVKGVLYDTDGNMLDKKLIEYNIISPKDGYAEEDPIIWKESTLEVLKYFGDKHYNVKGIGISGQMHGLVLLDKDDKVLRNSIIWCDGRTDSEKVQIEKTIGLEKCKSITGNIPMSAFTLAKLLWVKNNEPEIFTSIDKVLLPKDYISYILTGKFCSELSDLSGSQFLDIKKKDYSEELLSIFKIKKDILPQIIDSYAIRGRITPEIERITNLKDVFVVGGAADQAASALGAGIIKDDVISIVLGSSGVIFNPCKKLKIYPNGELQTLIDANSNYYNMGCTNCCGTSLKWLRDNHYNIPYEEMDKLACKVNPRENNLFFLPYLVGERTPILDNNARGVFFGLKNTTTKADIIRSVMEGVGYSIKDSFSMLDNKIKCGIISGGGAKSSLYKEIISSMLNLKLVETNSETSSLGVAILAMVAGKEFKNLDEAAKNIVKYHNEIFPNKDLVEYYNEGYKIYKEIYNNTKEIFKKIK